MSDSDILRVKLLSSIKTEVLERSFNVIILSQLTIFGSQAHCCKLTNSLKALHETGLRYFQCITPNPPTHPPHTHVSHQGHPTAPFWHFPQASCNAPFQLTKYAFPQTPQFCQYGCSYLSPCGHFLSSWFSSPLWLQLSFTVSSKSHCLAKSFKKT